MPLEYKVDDSGGRKSLPGEVCLLEKSSFVSSYAIERNMMDTRWFKIGHREKDGEVERALLEAVVEIWPLEAQARDSPVEGIVRARTEWAGFTIMAFKKVGVSEENDETGEPETWIWELRTGGKWL